VKWSLYELAAELKLTDGNLKSGFFDEFFFETYMKVLPELQAATRRRPESTLC
jgi:hypothetical protein